ncbi:DUF5701 family protein [Nocardioides sp. 616]|uniref:DUF5701 family protein n=1 Tax=Nocardioides sp. 616 TaxID=2268090 RepID=UPI000CE4EED8|nr:DUF5701 family protein [Nocardioides sp. 616]
MSGPVPHPLQPQVDRLVELGYPALAGLDETAFRARLAPLLALELPQSAGVPADPLEAGRVPYVVVVDRTLVAPEQTVPLLRLPGSSRPGTVDRHHPQGGLEAYLPLSELDVPAGGSYLLVDVDRGEKFCGVAPEQALGVIREGGRTPLTIEEGIAVLTQAPYLLERNKCFSLAGSRRGDRRVPGLWISDRAPKLGWCWDGNPHDWLGVASAGARLSAP